MQRDVRKACTPKGFKVAREGLHLGGVGEVIAEERLYTPPKMDDEEKENRLVNRRFIAAAGDWAL